MPKFTHDLPLSLYVHIPWCVRKCPYCDFNSHQVKADIPEELYVRTLLQELDNYLPLIAHRPLVSIFFGGGTPSLFSGKALEMILNGVTQLLIVPKDIEITLEANPGTIDQVRFKEFKQAGINRLSLGIQSLQDDKLKTLGRIHDSDHAKKAIQLAKDAGFDNFNVDLMFGLPEQTLNDALFDLKTALDFAPTHLSWYQLTIEPNTLFYKQTPTLPLDDTIWEMQLAGQELLKTAGYSQYEVSAYSQINKECRHNRNYWEFGDYLGIGAGAHSKITDAKTGVVQRFVQVRHPKDYLNPETKQSAVTVVTKNDLIFEFMLNALRLTKGVPTRLFTDRTGINIEEIEANLGEAIQKGLLNPHNHRICASGLGFKYLNNLISLFLP